MLVVATSRAFPAELEKKNPSPAGKAQGVDMPVDRRIVIMGVVNA